MLPAGILKERAKLSGVDLDWRTTKEPTGLSDKISIVMSLKKKKYWLDGASEKSFRFCTFVSDFLRINCIEFPISLSKLKFFIFSIMKNKSRMDHFSETFLRINLTRFEW